MVKPNNRINKKVIVISCIGLVALTSIISATCLETKKVDIKKNSIVEYGDKVNTSYKELIKNYQDFNSKDISITSKIKNEQGKDYPAVGKYDVKVKYKGDTYSQKVTVKDTTKPTLEVPETIDIIQGTDLSQFDFNNYYKVVDLSQLKDNQVDWSSVDVNTVGSYTVKISVSDIYDNKAEKDLTINVQEAPAVATDEVVVQEKVVDNSGKVTYKPVVKKATVAASSGQTAISSPNIQKPTNTTPSTPTQTTPSTPKVLKAGDSFTFDYPGVNVDGTIISFDYMTGTLKDNNGNFTHTETRSKNGHTAIITFVGTVDINTGKVIAKDVTSAIIDGVECELVFKPGDASFN